MMAFIIFVSGIAFMVLGFYFGDWLKVVVGVAIWALPFVAFVTSCREAARTEQMEADQRKLITKAQVDLIERFAEQQEKKGNRDE